MYGETTASSRPSYASEGLSPRVRGNLGAPHGLCGHDGSILACTGKPARPQRPLVSDKVYPRVYGETMLSSWARVTRNGLSPRVRETDEADMLLTVEDGLSPRVRGNPWHTPVLDPVVGSIPACTGKPAITALSPGATKVYPRVYGETCVVMAVSSAAVGLSPRVRGNQQDLRDYHDGDRSIPACTGKP